jgi:hypothetical protein
MLGFAIYRAVKNKRACVHMKKQLMALTGSSSKNLENISKLVNSKREHRIEMTKIQKEINAQVVKMKAVTN